MRDIHLRVKGFVVGSLIALVLAGCDQSGWEIEPAPPREVDVLTVKREPFTRTDVLPGRVEPVRVAEVRARVAGIVLNRAFEEGSDVKAGDVLFQIDPAPFKATLGRAEGQLAQAEAQLMQAQATVRRYEPLVKIDAVSQQDFDAAKAALQSAEAVKRSAQADVQTAKLELGYSTVRAPIAGRIGRAEVTEGALVGQGEATLLARIQQLDPVYVDFKQPVADALRLRRTITDAPDAGPSRSLSVSFEGAATENHGSLQFTDTAVDRGTGEVTLRGRFDNPSGDLLPGMYVRVHAPQSQGESILVPQRAVLRDPTGQASVMLLGPDNVVESRPVVTGVMQGSRWQIKEGLQEGDQLIVSSLIAIQPGVTVVPRQHVTAADTSTRPNQAQ
ncbi:TPA: efflux RND transporter periplasmic adaptor subunit [Pseudomonas aeruginosa]|uniref:efflux RND transporter periplasmic adaptor subunit n=1 Tax=Pseudomonas aeruginosa TaxID=287 RepID=UPI000F52950E|nr:efflux RND transporter periplasmic adaptor subunit [Pseudomonas aeruginosa]HEM7588802.1 efflux RND transporter periplasmic adaptor subunit [Serratia marcescens]EKV4129855.1 efflux RND transporter periplasmic adaptor subunit [Pseudomonas aeruginosa]EKV4132327.1 efflux RND transporter periplasmic adaptor subunit [Pseudomonas aeruginosa]EKW1534497.1 efflux RND transporter periplasmic adaptor subunit [Pseudomonas aeruginosa]EKW1536634.1 efflux RND transporter periplasmic adaptor subunit [Pseudo